MRSLVLALVLRKSLLVAADTAYGTYHIYDAKDSLTTVSCSDGTNGLMTRWGYQTLEPMFPYVSAMAGVTWNSPSCGTCVCLVDAAGHGSVCVTVIDACGSV